MYLFLKEDILVSCYSLSRFLVHDRHFSVQFTQKRSLHLTKITPVYKKLNAPFAMVAPYKMEALNVE